MCFPSCKTLLILTSFVAIVVILFLVVGPSVIIVPMEKIQQFLPKPHLQVTFGMAQGANNLDYTTPYEEAGFEVHKGFLMPLYSGTCTQCMGSPGYRNSHLAVSFTESEQIQPSCGYYKTNQGVCFSLDKNEAVMIFTEGPPKGVFDAFSWGVYLYDRFDVNARDIIQAPLLEPLRLQDSGPIVLIVSYMPELSDALLQSIDLPDIDSRSIFILPISTDLVQTDLGVRNNDRVAILLKTEPKNEEAALEFYNLLQRDTEILKLKVKDRYSREKTRKGATYRHTERFGYLSGKSFKKGQQKESHFLKVIGKMSSEKTTFGPAITQLIEEFRRDYFVGSATQMVVLRDILGITNIQNCIGQDLNCLAEDWDISFTVSGPLIFPDPPNYKIAIIGVDHPEGQLTTLGLFNINTNQEVVPLPRIEANGGLYVIWTARNCSTSSKTCVEIPDSIAPNATPLYLRERVYGVHSYENLVAPFVLKIKDG